MGRNWERRLRMNSPNEFIALIHFDFSIRLLADHQVRVALYLIAGKPIPSTENGMWRLMTRVCEVGTA